MDNLFNEHFVRAFVVTIVLAIFGWTMRRPAKKIDGGGIVLKFSPVIYGLIIVPMLMIATVFSWALWSEGMSEEAILPLGLGGSMVLGFGWLLRFLMSRKVIANDNGVLQQKGKRQKHLKWADVKSVKYDRYWIKLMGDAEEVAVNINLTGCGDFITMMREKLPAEMCDEVANIIEKHLFGAKGNRN